MAVNRKRVIIWGIEQDYDKCCNAIKLEVLKGNMEIVSYVAKNCAFKYMEGIRICNKEEIADFEYDYLIIAANKSFNEILSEALEIGVDRDKIVRGDVFLCPGFDFGEYTRIKERNITIISEDCWGAYTYNYLNLPFNSPFISLHVKRNDYIKLLRNLKDFISSELHYAQADETQSYEPDYRGAWPRGYLQDEKGDVVWLEFNHSVDFDSAKNDWNRRKQRINWDDIFVKMTINSYEMAEKFSELPFDNKIGFYYKDTNLDSIVNMRAWSDFKLRERMGYEFYYFILRCADKSEAVARQYNVLKLLNGESDFMRRY